MQYRTIKKTGEKISTLGFGCMRLPQKNGKIDVALAKEQIRFAIDNGVNYLDTAWIYHMGASESFLGEHILTDGYREKVNIATKLPCFMINKASQMEEIFEKQRKKLKVETIDYYLLHALDGATFDKMLSFGIIDFMDKLKSDGKIRNMGFSFHGTYDDFTRITDAYDWDFCQVQFNIIDEDYQAGIKGIKYANKKGLGVFIMEPLRGGALVNKLPKQVLDTYSESEIKRNPVDWALRWILDHEEVTMLLSGMNSKSQVMDNIVYTTGSLPNKLTNDEKIIISRVKDEYNKLITVKCTDCKYCMPCPAGIDIPYSFKSLNEANIFSSRIAKVVYVRTVAVNTKDGKAHWASSCMNCGKCESACPQNLPIRDNLKLVHKKLEGMDSKAIAFVAKIFNGKS